MAYYVVFDQQGQKHVVWANNMDDAVSKVPGTESVRTANVIEIEEHEKEQEELDGNAA